MNCFKRGKSFNQVGHSKRCGKRQAPYYQSYLDLDGMYDTPPQLCTAESHYAAESAHQFATAVSPVKRSLHGKRNQKQNESALSRLINLRLSRVQDCTLTSLACELASFGLPTPPKRCYTGTYLMSEVQSGSIRQGSNHCRCYTSNLLGLEEPPAYSLREAPVAYLIYL